MTDAYHPPTDALVSPPVPQQNNRSRAGCIGEGMNAKTGVELIADERQRQITDEGWTPEHDDEHSDGELGAAASCYAAPEWSLLREHQPPLIWPWDEEWWKPGDRIRELVKAGALIAAEIDRLQRIEAGK